MSQDLPQNNNWPRPHLLLRWVALIDKKSKVLARNVWSLFTFFCCSYKSYSHTFNLLLAKKKTHSASYSKGDHPDIWADRTWVWCDWTRGAWAPPPQLCIALARCQDYAIILILHDIPQNGCSKKCHLFQQEWHSGRVCPCFQFQAHFRLEPWRD